MSSMTNERLLFNMITSLCQEINLQKSKLSNTNGPLAELFQMAEQCEEIIKHLVIEKV